MESLDRYRRWDIGLKRTEKFIFNQPFYGGSLDHGLEIISKSSSVQSTWRGRETDMKSVRILSMEQGPRLRSQVLTLIPHDQVRLRIFVMPPYQRLNAGDLNGAPFVLPPSRSDHAMRETDLTEGANGLRYQFTPMNDEESFHAFRRTGFKHVSCQKSFPGPRRTLQENRVATVFH